MKKIDWEKFKTEKIAVHCKTKEEAKDFCQKMHEHGMKWITKDFYIDNTMWDTYGIHTCYNGRGQCCYYDYYEKHNYAILEWSDYMEKEFTKSDLRDGMVVEYRNGDRFVVFGGKLLNDSSYDMMNEIREDLTDIGFNNRNFDIVKVYYVCGTEASCLRDVLKDENLKLIWERNENKRMTAEEMRKKLEELTGEKIEIDPSRNEMVGTCYEFCVKHQCSKECVLYRIGNCRFKTYSDEKLKRCYEKVMEDGRKES